MNRRHFFQSSLAAAVAYALPAPRLYALDQAATQAAGGAVSAFTSFRSVNPAGTGPATAPGSNTGGNGAAYLSGGLAPFYSTQSVGFSPGGWGGCWR